MKQAVVNFRGRILNALLGCATGLLFLLVGGANEWKLPVALAATVLLSSYVIRIPAMCRQAPITAAIIIAAVLTHHSKLSGIEIGLRGYARLPGRFARNVVYVENMAPAPGSKSGSVRPMFSVTGNATALLHIAGVTSSWRVVVLW
jgi:hypothetical protein